LFKRDTSSGDDNEDEFKHLTKEEIEACEKAINGRTQGGTTYPRSDYAYTPDSVPSHWKLRLTNSPGGKPDPGIVGAAAAALGKGFRGKKVIIPSSDRPAVVARVRAAWKQANPDKELSEAPEVLQKLDQGEVNKMTLEEIEKRVTDQQKDLDVLKAENNVLKTERELVLKMSKKQRKAYASMSDDQQKAFMAADEEKRDKMCKDALLKLKQKAAEDSMDEACKAEFAKAGPTRRLQMLAEQDAKLAKARNKGRDSEDDSDDEDDDEDGDEDLKLRKMYADTNDRILKAEERVQKAEAELAVVNKRDRLVYFTKRAELELPNTPGTPVEKGSDLMAVAEGMPGGENGDLFRKYMDNMKAADKALTIHFGEVGKAGGDIPASKALEAKAAEIAKRDKIDESHAMMKAMEEEPELYIAYEQQHRRAIHAA
jgi:hypothetical protein